MKIITIVVCIVVCIGALLLVLMIIKKCNSPTYVRLNSSNVIPCKTCFQKQNNFVPKLF